MGYVLNTETAYKVGDVIKGKNSINIKIINVSASGAVDIEVVHNHPGTTYYYFDDTLRKLRKEPDKWLKLPSNKILKNISECGKVMFKVERNTKQTKVIDKWSWWGNKMSVSKMLYGCPPYGSFYGPKDKNQLVPNKKHEANKWRPEFGLDSTWKYVDGSYKWAPRSTDRNDWYGWRKEVNTLHVRNYYARRFSLAYTKGNNTIIESDWISLDKIRVTTSTFVPMPIRSYVYRTPKKATSEVTWNELKKINFKGYRRLSPYPTPNKFAVPDNNYNDTLNFLWTSEEDEDDSKFQYQVVKVKYTNAYIDKVIEYQISGSALTGELTDVIYLNDDDPEIDNTDLENSRLAGRYEYEIVGLFDGKADQKVSQKFIIDVVDNTDPIKPVIVDALDSRVVYNMDTDITTLDHTPTWKKEKEHVYRSTYDYYAYVDEGYDVEMKEEGVEFQNGKTTFSADGQYYLHVTATYRNGKSVTTTACFMIDKRLPNCPTIIINDIDEYVGPWLHDDDYKNYYLNNAVMKYKLPPYTRAVIHIWFKKFKFNEWEHVGVDTLPKGGVYNRLGKWRVTIAAEKTLVHYPDGSGLRSENSEVVFSLKKKLTHKLDVRTYLIDREIGMDYDTNDYTVDYKEIAQTDSENTKAYKAEATIDFVDLGIWDSGNMELRYILDDEGNKIIGEDGNYKTSIDYDGVDISSKLYRINGKEWIHYLDKIIIYKNCTIECKSVDDDGFESYVTKKDVKVIDPNDMPDTLRIEKLDTLSSEKKIILETGTTLIIK